MDRLLKLPAGVVIFTALALMGMIGILAFGSAPPAQAQAALSDVATLSALAISDDATPAADVTLEDPAFDSAVTTGYEATVANTVKSVTVTATPTGPSAMATIGGMDATGGLSVPLEVGEQTVTIKVTAEDGTTMPYFVIITRMDEPKSADATLMSLELRNPGELQSDGKATLLSFDGGDFAPAIEDHSSTVENSVESVTVTAMATHDMATIKITASSGNSVLPLNEDGSWTLAGEAASAVTTIDIDVMAEDGTVKTYSITIIRLDRSLDDATLASVTLIAENFAQDLVLESPPALAYTGTVASFVSSVEVTPKPANQYAKYVIANADGDEGATQALVAGPNAMTIIVTAEDGTTTETYTVDVTKQTVAEDNHLKSLSVSPVDLEEEFRPHRDEILYYNVVVGDSVKKVTVTATPSVPGATVAVTVEEGLGVGIEPGGVVTLNTADAGLTIITVTVTPADDTSPVKEYSVFVAQTAAGMDQTLKSLMLSPGVLAPVFDSDTPVYTAKVVNSVASVIVTAIANDPNAKVEGAGTVPLEEGEQTVTIKVTAEDDTVARYYVIINYTKPSTDATLSALSLSDSSGAVVISPDFAADTLAYTARVANSVTSVGVTATPADSGATHKAIGYDYLDEGTNTIRVMVTAEDSTTKTYTVAVTRADPNASDEATLSALSLWDGDNAVAISPAFAANTTDYTAMVDNSVTSVDVTATPAHRGASSRATGHDSLDVGDDNTITVTVTAEDGTTTKDYLITVTRAASTDATLSALSLWDGSDEVVISPDFAPDTTDYTARVATSVTSVTVTAPTTHRVAKAAFDGNDSLEVGEDDITVVVTAEDGSTMMTYTVTVTRAASDASEDATLSALSLWDGSDEVDIDPVFAADTMTYTAMVENSVMSVDVDATPAHSGATHVVTGHDSLDEGTNTITVTVTAEDSEATEDYVITVTRPVSADATLSALSLWDGSDEVVISPAFTANTMAYTARVANSVTSVGVTATPADADSGATRVVDGGDSLTVGDTTITITVTAEDNTTEQDYTVTVTRAGTDAGTDATLSALSLSDGSNAVVITPDFAAETLAYTARVANSVTSVAVDATTADRGASYRAIGYDYLDVRPNTINVIVTAEDSTTETYTVTVTRVALDASDDATLSALSLSDSSSAVAISPAFAAETLAYTAMVDTSVTSVDVTATLTDSGASFMVTGGDPLTVGANNIITVTVTAADSETTEDYVITVTRPASTDATLSALSLWDGSDEVVISPDFAADTTEYTARVANSVTSVDVTATPAHSVASAAVTGDDSLTVGEDAITIIVTAEDGTATMTYTVAVTRAAFDADTDATLSALSLSDSSGNAVAITPDFAADTTDYTAMVITSVTSVVVDATPADDGAYFMVTGGDPLTVGDNTVTITVTAEDSMTTENYTVTVTRPASNDATLSALSLWDGSDEVVISPVFAADTLAYTARVDNSVMSVTVTATPAHSGASAVVTGHGSLDVGANTITITVTAEDSTTTMPYTVTVTQAGTGTGDPLLDKFDTSGNGMIERAEVIAAINRYLLGEAGITRPEVIAVINLYLGG